MAGIATIAAAACAPDQPPSSRLPDPPPPTPVVLLAGDSLFVAHCQQCHGKLALGSDRGPPLLHAIYAPSHHGDAAFLLAVRNGVRAHHWTFGNMDPVPSLTEAEAVDITAYVRWLQMVAGIN